MTRGRVAAAASVVLVSAGIAALAASTDSEPAPPAKRLCVVADINDSTGADRPVSALARTLSCDRIVMPGDIAYERGRKADYERFARTWGWALSRIWPVPGNHDRVSSYYPAFWRQQVTKYLPPYRRELGAWTFYGLDSNTGQWAQNTWREAHPPSGRCSGSIYHHPRYSTGDYRPGIATSEPLHLGGGDVLLTGHDHNYQRFYLRQAMQWVVGTGGRDPYQLGQPIPGLRYAITGRSGVLLLLLRPGSYSWSFHTTAGPVVDPGGRRCVGE